MHTRNDTEGMSTVHTLGCGSWPQSAISWAAEGVPKSGEAGDVCGALEIGNSRMALSRLDDDEKGVTTADTHHGSPPCITSVPKSGEAGGGYLLYRNGRSGQGGLAAGGCLPVGIRLPQIEEELNS